MIKTATITTRYNNAICNDGSTAVYYVDEEAHRDGQSVMVGIPSISILQKMVWWLCSNILVWGISWWLELTQVYLEGGGACYTDQTCSDRCEGKENTLK